MERKYYTAPTIKVCDYIARYRLMDDVDPGITTSQALGKENDRSFEEYEEAAQPDIRRSVWDD